MAALTILGAFAYTTIPASIFPTMSFARVDVVIGAGDLPPERVRIAIAQPLERAFGGLPSVTRTLATSTQGSAELIVEFDPTTDVRNDLQSVDQAIAAAAGVLPLGITSSATVINPNSEPVLSYAFSSPLLSQTVVHEMIVQNLVPAFSGVPGLARTLAVGGPEREYNVDLDAAALAAHGLSAGDVGRAVADANAVTAPGIATAFAQRNVLVVDSRILDARSLGAVVVPDARRVPTRLDALGRVSLGVAPATTAMSFDASHAVGLNFYALPGADTVKMADAVEARMRDLAPRLPGGTHATKYWDQTRLIRDSQSSLRDAIGLGALLAIGVILLFLRNLRMTLIAAVVIPLAIAITIFAIGRMGQTLNLMSVGGLAVAVGLIIDDAIVVIENIARNLHAHPTYPKREIVVQSMRELIAPMSASTLTTVVVFVPLVLLSGVSGFFFRALATTLGTSLVVSLGLAVFLTPILAEQMMQPAGAVHDDVGFVARLLARYEPLLRWALGHRRTVYVASAGILVVTALLLTRLPSDFLPKLDEGQFEIRYQMPVGTALEASDAAATQLERVALADPAVVSVGRFTGIDTNGFAPTPVRNGTIRIALKPRSQRDSFDAISERMRGAMQKTVPAVQLNFHQILEDIIDDISGAPAPLEITVRGTDERVLEASATSIADRIAKVPGVTDVFSGVTHDDPAVRVAPNAARLAALGLNANDVSDAIAASTQGMVPTSLAGSATLVPVRLRVAGGGGAPGTGLLATSAGVLQLNSLATTARDVLTSDVTDENAQRVLIVTANYGGTTLSAVVAGVRSALARTPLPPGYTWSIGGAYRAQQQSFREFATVVAIAIALVFFVMLATFGSFRLPLVVLTAIPLALIGVALGLFATGTPFNVSSFMGLLLLVGLIVKNGILLIDVANRKRAEGASIDEALVTAGRLRLRP
ncbi:MAG: efflux RND transporter permease subunit, partial [Candidatus Eremiobacteraeota bacterium]|nr:efflux RND transporter permease subunit [Candidatus Eremiobacteraeota bacterium]